MFRILYLINSIGITLILASCQRSGTSLPYYNTADFEPVFISKKEAQVKINHTIAPFKFTDQHGRIFNSDSVKNKIHIASFFFTRCGSICPAIMSNLLQIQSKFSRNPEVEILSFSVTPWIDSVPVLLNYAEAHGIKSSNWHLLTGSREEIYKLARQSYFAEESLGFGRNSSDFLHTEHLLLVDKDFHLRGIYNGTLKTDVINLEKDIEILIDE